MGAAHSVFQKWDKLTLQVCARDCACGFTLSTVLYRTRPVSGESRFIIWRRRHSVERMPPHFIWPASLIQGSSDATPWRGPTGKRGLAVDQPGLGILCSDATCGDTSKLPRGTLKYIHG